MITVNSFRAKASARRGLVIWVYLFLRWTITGRTYIQMRPPKAPVKVRISPILLYISPNVSGIKVKMAFMTIKCLLLTAVLGKKMLSKWVLAMRFKMG